MEVTGIEIKIAENEYPVRAYCSVIFDNSFIIRKIRIVEKNNKFLIYMPSIKNKQGMYSDVCHSLNPKMRAKIETAILHQFMAVLKSTVIPPDRTD